MVHGIGEGKIVWSGGGSFFLQKLLVFRCAYFILSYAVLYFGVCVCVCVLCAFMCFMFPLPVGVINK